MVCRICLELCNFILLNDPGSFPRAHDLHKMSSSYTFYKSMSTQEICDLVGWSLIRMFKRHCLKQIGEISPSLVALGSFVKGSARAAD